MQAKNSSHSESISLAGFYYGVLGVFLSAVGIALSIYYSNSGEKSYWLVLSGWIAAILIGSFLTFLCLQLLRINASINQLALEQAQKSTELAARVGELEYANERLTEIGSYVIATTAKGSAKPRRRAATTPKKAPTKDVVSLDQEPEDVMDEN